MQAKHKLEMDRLTDDMERKHKENVNELKETLSDRHEQVTLFSDFGLILV